MPIYRNKGKQYSLVYNGQLLSAHDTLSDAVLRGTAKQKQDYKLSGEAKRYTVHHEQHGLQHEEDGYDKTRDDRDW